MTLYWTPMPTTALRYHVFMTNRDDPTIIDLGYAYQPTFKMSVGPSDIHYFWVEAENSDCATPTSNIVGAPNWLGYNLFTPGIRRNLARPGADLFWDQVDGAAGYVVFSAKRLHGFHRSWHNERARRHGLQGHRAQERLVLLVLVLRGSYLCLWTPRRSIQHIVHHGRFRVATRGDPALG